jgi:hypothetical protein
MLNKRSKFEDYAIVLQGSEAEIAIFSSLISQIFLASKNIIYIEK